MTALDILLAALLLFIGWAANESGMFFNVLFIIVLLMVPVRVTMVLWRVWRKRLEYRFWRAPSGKGLYWLQAANGWSFLLLAALILEVCIVPAQFSAQEYLAIRVMVWGSVMLLSLLELLPGKRLYAATNLVFAAGSLFMAAQMLGIFWPVSKTDGVVLSAPFRGDWLVVQGGNSSLINHHYRVSSQRDALDMERLVEGRERTADRTKRESYFSWGETLYAPADGKVAKVRNDCEDNAIGHTDAQHLAGNYISIDMGNQRFVLLAHLQKGSVRVAEGDAVRAGQPIARCGNSGNTSQPHLHIQVQDRAQLSAPGVKTYPILFRDVTGIRSGGTRQDAPFSMRRNDRVISDTIHE